MNDVTIVKEGWLHKRGQCGGLACRLLSGGESFGGLGGFVSPGLLAGPSILGPLDLPM